MKKNWKEIVNIILIVIFLFLIFLLIYDLLGKSILESSVYNSYELQTRAWLNGKTYLDHNYPYLELAIYNGHFYVSFPPLPSVLLIPFALIFKESIPTNFIVFVLFTLEYIIIYRILRKYRCSEWCSILLASGFTIGSNLMCLAFNSGVWFFAQILNNLLCILSVKYFLEDRKILTYLFLALAVGCRPFSIIYLFLFFFYNIIHDKDNKLYRKTLNNIIYLIPTMIIGLTYMWYNYIRFGNFIEFGHNYLPEFVESTYGQFSLHYLLPNLKELFFNGIHLNSKLNFNFSMPFCFIIANPIIIVFLYRIVKNIKKTKKIDKFRLTLFIFLCINIIAICLHKTLGAVQFGARYICDILPFVFLEILWYKNKNGCIKEIKLNKWEIACIIFGIIINIYGIIILYTRMLA